MRRQKGFTLIELLIVVNLLGIILSFAMPAVWKQVQNSRKATCLLYRQNIQVAADIYIRRYNLQMHDDLPNLQTLIDEGILLYVDQCPSGGVYTWNHNHYHAPVSPYYLNCSLHFAAP